QRVVSPTPSARYGPALAFDDATQQLVLFGGVDAVTFNTLADTWVWLPPSTNLVPQAPTIAKDASGNYLVTVTLLNSGNIPLTSIQITSAKLGATTSATFNPLSTSTVAAGATVSFTATFPPSTGVKGAALAVLFTGTYTSGAATNAPWT